MARETLDTAPIDRIVEAVGDLLDVDFMPLMDEWRTILYEDNERFARAGLDKDEQPLAAVTYRPKDPPPKKVDYTVLTNNNLTHSHYLTLDGPPLLPRPQGGAFGESRVIANFVTRAVQFDEPSGGADAGDYGVMAGWRDFLTPDDEEILPRHFEGLDGLPQRDLRGIRESTFRACVDTGREFIQAMFDRAFERV